MATRFGPRRSSRTAAIDPCGRARQPQNNRDVLARLRIVQEADRAALGGHLDRRRHLRRRHACRARARLVDHQRRLRLRRRDVPVDVDDARRALEHGFHLAGELETARRIRAVDFRDQRLQHRRPGGTSDT